MNTSSKLIAIAIIGVLISTELIPVVNSSVQSRETYEIELYEMNGFIRKKHTAKVSYETLMDIKDELEWFDGTISEEMWFCFELLTEKGVFTEAEWKSKWIQRNPNSMNKNKHFENDRTYSDIIVFNGHFIGNFQFVVSSPSHVLFAAPILAMIAGPSSIEYGSSYMEYSSLGLLLFIVMGLILIIPIFSSVGYINAEVVFAFGFGYK